MFDLLHLTNAISQATSHTALVAAWLLYILQAFSEEATQLSQLLATEGKNLSPKGLRTATGFKTGWAGLFFFNSKTQLCLDDS